MLRFLSRKVGGLGCIEAKILPNSSKRLLSTAHHDHGVPVYVKAHYISRGIDVLRAYGEVYAGCRQQFHSKSVTISIDPSQNQHVAIYKYGSVVFFNIPENEQKEHLRNISEVAATSPILDGSQYTENYKIMIHKHLEKPSVIKAEHLNIQKLDMNNISIVSTVMAQTVALDHYAVAVEKMLEKFIEMNMELERKGAFGSLEHKGLYKLIASNNTVITNMLSKLGLFEGSDAAWDNAEYHYTFEQLRRDFELDFRFKDLYLKLDVVKDNTRFFLEMLHNKNSTKLEWTIIILIAVEICIGFSGLAIGAMPH